MVLLNGDFDKMDAQKIVDEIVTTLWYDKEVDKMPNIFGYLYGEDSNMKMGMVDLGGKVAGYSDELVNIVSDPKTKGWFMLLSNFVGGPDNKLVLSGVVPDDLAGRSLTITMVGNHINNDISVKIYGNVFGNLSEISRSNVNTDKIGFFISKNSSGLN